MSLVAYGSSDESDDESEHIESKVTQSIEPNSKLSISQSITTSKSVLEEKDYQHNLTELAVQPLFQQLPKPGQSSPTNENNHEELESHEDIPILAFLPVPSSLVTETDLNRKSSGPVKITLPSLSEFDDEDNEPKKKKLKPSKKGSGLFAILPAPKNTKHREIQQPLIPHVLTKRVSQTPPTSVGTNIPTVDKPSLLEADYDSGNEEDFFSLNSVKTLPNEELPSSLAEEPISFIPQDKTINQNSVTVTSEIYCENRHSRHADNHAHVTNAFAYPGSSKDNYNKFQNEENVNYDYIPQPTVQEPTISLTSENLQLDAEAMQRLCGRRSKKNQEPVEIIDVNGTEIMPDPNEWLVKQLSEEQPKMRSHSHKRNDGPTTQQRRKHQITYLAFQAKENELELKNQWSQNRMTRKQTQSKYGF